MSDEPLLYAPLQAIDPDSQEQMERFADLHAEAWQRIRDRNPDRVGTPTWEIVAEQFRLFKDPNYRAKPDEPKGLGAVIEDANGSRWLRFEVTGPCPWMYVETGERGDADRRYEDINAVRVLNWGHTD